MPESFRQVESHWSDEQFSAFDAPNLFALHLAGDQQVLAAFGIRTTMFTGAHYKSPILGSTTFIDEGAE
jgi:hypothetical protein